MASPFSPDPPATGPIPRFEDLRPRLPQPVLDDEPGLVSAWWKAWELAFDNFRAPAPGSRLVSNFIDAAFNQCIFQWDTCFMTMFCDAAAPLVPGICSLDNFYAAQHPGGEISREIVRDTGVDFEPWRNTEGRPLFSRWGYDVARGLREVPVQYVGRTPPAHPPAVTLEALNHPIFAWSELEHWRWTADRERLERVWEPLVRYHAALREHLRQGNGLFMTDWASMDNSPRNRFLEGGGTGVDISSEMVLLARQLAEIGRIIGKSSEAAELDAGAADTAGLINALMWNPQRRFYFDLTKDGAQVPVKTVAAYWTLLAGVAPADRAEALVAELANPRTFGRRNPVPTLAADERGFKRTGGYWRGAAWAPTTTMVIRGLERCGHAERAREIAAKHARLVAEVLERTGTIWEFYEPDRPRQGRVYPGRWGKRDFVGWSGIGPILFLLEHVIGLRPAAPQNTLAWRVGSAGRCGCRRFLFGGHRVSVIAEREEQGKERVVRVESDGAFRLELSWAGRAKSVDVTPGETEVRL